MFLYKWWHWLKYLYQNPPSVINADDTVLLLESVGDLQTQLDIFSDLIVRDGGLTLVLKK